MKIFYIENSEYHDKRILAKNMDSAMCLYKKYVERSLSADYSVEAIMNCVKSCVCEGDFDARKELAEMEYDNLKSTFNNLISTNNIFWDLLSYVEERDTEMAINYLVDKIINDCLEIDIYNEIHDYE